ncbi:choice-of-anchor Q domain-containing protein [Porphyrobacter sp. TH134]
MLTGSPAIDAARTLGSPAVDILGNRRPRGSGVDIGAIESF